VTGKHHAYLHLASPACQLYLNHGTASNDAPARLLSAVPLRHRET